MRGHLRPRGKRGTSWELKFDAGRDAAGKRKTAYQSFRGTKREAQAKLAELIAAVKKGEHVARSPKTVAEYVTERIDRWAALRKITPKTAERYRELAANQITPHIGAIRLQDLKAADIEVWHATLCEAGRKDGKGGLSERTIGHAHRLLSKTLKEAARHDVVVRNVAAMEPPPKVEREEVVTLSAEQSRDVVCKLRGHAIYPQVIIALFGGLRRGEILGLRWQHADLDRKVIAVRASIEETDDGLRVKTAKTQAGMRDVALPDVVVDVLRDYRRRQLEQRLALGLGKLTDDTLLFVRPSGALYSPRLLSKQWRKAAAAIGVNANLHVLRHTHASFLIDAGVDVVKISKRLGHSSPTVTLDTYAHLFERREDKSAAVINDAVAALLTAR
jgi:integrase